MMRLGLRGTDWRMTMSHPKVVWRAFEQSHAAYTLIQIHLREVGGGGSGL